MEINLTIILTVLILSILTAFVVKPNKVKR